MPGQHRQRRHPDKGLKVRKTLMYIGSDKQFRFIGAIKGKLKLRETEERKVKCL